MRCTTTRAARSSWRAIVDEPGEHHVALGRVGEPEAARRQELVEVADRPGHDPPSGGGAPCVGARASARHSRSRRLDRGAGRRTWRRVRIGAHRDRHRGPHRRLTAGRDRARTHRPGPCHLAHRRWSRRCDRRPTVGRSLSAGRSTHEDMAPASVPTLELVGPGGRRVVVAPRSPDDRVGELADCARARSRGAASSSTAGPSRAHETIARAGIVRGSRLASCAPTPCRPRRRPGRRRRVRCRSRRRAPRRAGRPVATSSDVAAVPRCASTIRRVEAHHGAPRRGDGRRGDVAQLTGRVPCRVDGEPLASRRGRAAGRRGDARRQPAPARPARAPRLPHRRSSRPSRGIRGAASCAACRAPVRRWSPDPIPVPTIAAPGRAARPGRGSSPRSSPQPALPSSRS